MSSWGHAIDPLPIIPTSKASESVVVLRPQYGVKRKENIRGAEICNWWSWRCTTAEIQKAIFRWLKRLSNMKQPTEHVHESS